MNKINHRQKDIIILFLSIFIFFLYHSHIRNEFSKSSIVRFFSFLIVNYPIFYLVVLLSIVFYYKSLMIKIIHVIIFVILGYLSYLSVEPSNPYFTF